MKVSQDTINVIDQSLVLLFDKESQKDQAFVNNCGAVEFLNPEAFRVFYLLGEQLRNADSEKYQSMIKIIKRTHAAKVAADRQSKGE